MEDFGVQVYRYGVVFHGDQRERRRGLDGEPSVLPSHLERRTMRWFLHEGHPVEFTRLVKRRRGSRGRIRGFSAGSTKQLGFVSANAAAEFRTLLTLTYRAKAQEWESDGERNLRVVKRSKQDLHRFLCAVRAELGAYVWVQEFQARGVIHYHVICEREVADARVRLTWAQAIGALSDVAAFEHGAKATPIRDQARVRAYLGKYLGKCRQKELPTGVERAGRWWGRSRSLRLELVAEVVSCEKNVERGKRAEVRIIRCLRKYLARFFRQRVVEELARTQELPRRRQLKERLRRPFRGGWFVNWGGELSASLARMIVRLREAYGVTLEMPECLAEVGGTVGREVGCDADAEV